MTELAAAIDAIGDDDRRSVNDSVRVERLREQGAAELYTICERFVDELNRRLSRPALTLDPTVFAGENYSLGPVCLFQINLRGRLLQIEFNATEEDSCTDDFRRPYVLCGSIRAFNQNFLVRDTVDEKSLFYCPDGDGGWWHHFDSRTYAMGLVTPDFLAQEMNRLL